MPYTPWEPSQQTPEARAAVEAWAAHKMAAGEMLDLHDPEMLMMLDKGDVVSRYQLLINQHESKVRGLSEHHEHEMRLLRDTSEKALRWWGHCVRLRREKRKTARIEDMGL